MEDYRYLLHRAWSATGSVERVVWLMLNPSTADDERDDPTIRRCVSFSAREGAGSLTVVNLYALRATTPATLWTHPDPVGPDNDEQLRRVLAVAGGRGWPVVCAWGHRARPGRAAWALELLAATGCPPLVLGLTRDGHPRHPLYVPGRASPGPWPGARPAPDRPGPTTGEGLP